MASGDSLCHWTAWEGMLPTSNPPERSNVSGTNFWHNVVLFDGGSTTESAYYSGLMPAHYDAGGVDVSILWAPTDTGTGNVIWICAFERVIPGTTVITTAGFASDQTFAADAASGTANRAEKITLGVTNGANMDSVVAGDFFRLKISRNPSAAGDTYNSDAQLIRVLLEET